MVLDLIMGVFASRKRSITILIMIGIASSIIVCDLGYIDTLGIEKLRDFVDQVEIEAIVQANTWEGYNGTIYPKDLQYIQSHPQVLATEKVIEHYLERLNGSYLWEAIQDQWEHWWYYDSYLGVNPSFFDTFPGYLEIVGGSFNGSGDEALVHINLVRILGLEIGDHLTIGFTRGVYNEAEDDWREFEENFSVTITGFFEEQNSVDTSEFYGSYYSTPEWPLVIVPYEYAYSLDENLTAKHGFSFFEEKLYIDMSHDLVNLRLPEYSGAQLRAISEEIYPEIDSGYFQFLLLTAFMSYEAWVLSSRTQLIQASVLILGMAVILLVSTVYFSIIDKQVEIDMILARGALEGQISSMFYRELVRLGALGGVIGLGLGWGIGTFILCVEDFMVFDLSRLSIVSFDITLNTIITCWLFTFFIVMVTGYISNSQWRPQQQPIYPPDRKPPDPFEIPPAKPKKERSPRIKQLIAGIKLIIRIINWKAFLIALGVMAFSFYLFLLFINPVPSPSDIFNVTLIPFVTAYIVFRAGPPIFRWLLENAPEPIQIKRREFKSLQSLRKLIRRGQEVIGLVMVLTFAIALGFAATTASATLRLSAEDLANYQVGADIHLTSTYANASFPLSEAADLRNIPGVATATPVKVIQIDIGTYDYAYLIGINASEYVEVSYSLTGLPLKDSPERYGLLALQDNNQTVLINNFIIQALRKNPGDEINIAYTPEDGGRRRQSVTMEVGPIMAGLAGFSYQALMIMDLGVLLNLVNSSRVNHFLVNVETNANASIVADEITAQYYLNFDSVLINTELYRSWMGADLLQWLADTTTINFLYATIFAGLFFGVYVYTSFAKKKKEFTILRSIGLSQRQLIALSVFEILAFIFISIISGIGFGILFAFTSNIANLMSLTGTAFFSRRLIFTPMSISIAIILPLLSAIGATLIVGINFARTNLPRMLKLDIEFVRAYRAEAK